MIFVGIALTLFPIYAYIKYKAVFNPNYFDMLDEKMSRKGVYDERWWKPMFDWAKFKRRPTYTVIVRNEKNEQVSEFDYQDG